METVKKERLTDRDIVRDLLCSEAARFTEVLRRRCCLVVTFACMALLIGFFTDSVVAGLLFELVPLYHLLRLIEAIVVYVHRKREFTSGHFAVHKDTLVNVCEETVVEPWMHFRGHLHAHLIKEVHCLYFVSRKWRVTAPSEHYAWSERYRMSTEGLLNTSVIGNEFYTVLDASEQQIVYVYNMKFFDYSELPSNG